MFRWPINSSMPQFYADWITSNVHFKMKKEENKKQTYIYIYTSTEYTRCNPFVENNWLTFQHFCYIHLLHAYFSLINWRNRTLYYYRIAYVECVCVCNTCFGLCFLLIKHANSWQQCHCCAWFVFLVLAKWWSLW